MHKRWAGSRWAMRIISLALLSANLVIVSSLVGGLVSSTWLRLGAAALLCLGVPLAIRRRLRGWALRREDRRARLPGFIAGCNLIVLAFACLLLPATTGRALRRRGDWFLGEHSSPFAESYRRFVGRSARLLEQFNSPREAHAALAQSKAPTSAPPGSSQPPLPTEGQPPKRPGDGRWVHPVGEGRRGRRVMPPNASCRFGAPRHGIRRRECEQGHCGVDLPGPVGTPVYAAYDGVVTKVVRDERRGGIAGRFIKLSHKDDAVRTWYIHLDRIRADLRPGVEVGAGEALGTIGLTGVKRSGPHLHFAVAVKRGRGHRYIDPEPLLWFWRLPAARETKPATIAAAARGAAEPVSAHASHDMAARPATDDPYLR